MDLACHKLVFESQSAMVGRTFALSPLEALGSWWRELQ